ncbi:MAG: nucleotidyltransferase domain-containing protein [Defluviitaleaceae bacterium]|nr:nucleotidyltransferase domain-containing protein [Defluviitaleaceae bacterium]
MYNPFDNPTIKLVSQAVYAAAQNVLGDKLDKVYLFGSYARGDFDHESDIDYMIVANLPHEEACRQLLPIRDHVHELSYDLNLLISTCVTSHEMFTRFADTSMFYKNILTEGLEIYG